MEGEAMKRCRECRKGEMTTKRETYRYVECGLPHVALHDIEVRRCPECGAHEALIPSVASLHQLIARDVIEKAEKLSGAEVRFLRKHLGWSGVDFAAHMGVTPSTVSNWENDKEPIGPSADRLLRVMVAHGGAVQDYALADLKKITDEKGPSREMRFRAKSSKWETAAA